MEVMAWTKQTFAQRLIELRHSSGKKQSDVGKAIGVDQSEVSDWENDRKPRLPKPDQIEALANLFEKRPEYLLYGNEFEPMDDEERDVVIDLRKMSEGERQAVAQMFKAFVLARTITKKPGRRTPGVPKVELIEDAKSSPPSALPPRELEEFLQRLPAVSEVQKAQAGLLEHLSVLPIGTKAYDACEIPAILLRRLVATLRSKPQTAQQTDSPASSSGATQASVTKPPDRVPSDQPLPFPPEQE